MQTDLLRGGGEVHHAQIAHATRAQAASKAATDTIR
jgi:hypothetical protein